MLIKQSSAVKPLSFLLVNSTDHISPETGKTPTVTLSKNGAAFGSPAGAVTELANGWYRVAGNATDSNTLGQLILHATATGSDPVDVVYQVVAYDPDDAIRIGLSALPNANAEAAGGLYTRGSGTGQINQSANGQVDVNVEKWNTTDVPAEHSAGYPITTIKDGTGTGEINTNAGAVVDVTNVSAVTTVTNLTNAPTSGDLTPAMKASVGAEADAALADVGVTSVVTGRIDTTISSRLPTANITLSSGQVTVGTNNDKTNYSLSAAGIQAIWNALTSALTTVGSIGKKLADLVLGTDNFVKISADAHTSGVSVAAVTGNINGNVQGNVVGSVGSLAAQAKADVNAEADQALVDYDAPTEAQMNARTIPSADYATSTMLTAVKAKTDVQVDPFRHNFLQDGTLNSVTLDVGASDQSNFYRYCLLVIYGGVGINQARFITAYAGSDRIATVGNDFIIAPEAGDAYAIVPFAGVLTGVAWEALLSIVSGGGSATSTTGPTFVGADQSRDFTQIPGKLNMEGVVGNDLYMDILFENEDLTGYTFSAYVVLEPAPLQKTYPITVTGVSLDSGLIRVSLTDSDTTSVGPVANKPWYLAWSSPTGEQRNVCAGRFQLNRF